MELKMIIDIFCKRVKL